jgi:hypothetical protein
MVTPEGGNCYVWDDYVNHFRKLPAGLEQVKNKVMQNVNLVAAWAYNESLR